ncbi:TPA: phage portal protein [Burkholderia vietnamiensis]|nr:phage portal protein [Burkholderia vietnamiensis]
MSRAENVAFDADAPVEERTDALAQLQKAHAPSSLSGLLPNDAVRDVISYIQDGMAEAAMNKAINPGIVPFPSSRSKDGAPGMQSVFLDEWAVQVQGEYWDRPGGLGFDSLRAMVDQTPILNAVILTRIRQVQRFCRVAESGVDKPGFEIRHVDRKHKLTPEEQNSIQLLNRFITNCGWEFKPRRRKALRRDAFSQFMAKFVRDSLTMDSAPIELEWKRDKALGIDGFYSVDGSTIRLCTEQGYQGDDEVFALQVVQGRISTAYTFDDLIYEARNPRTDVTAAGYGLSETELLIRIVTGFLNALTHNIKGFDSNAIPKGMLHLSGNYTTDDIASFKRYWNAMVKGINNAWTLPVMVSKDQESRAAFEKFGVDFNEMYFAKWMTFLTSIICAVYGMSPAEINFDSFTGGSTSALSGSDTGEKLAASKDSGLRPLMAYAENTLTDYIISDFSDKFVFRWTGLDPEDAERQFEEKKLIMSVDELRSEHNLGQYPGSALIGGAPLNPQLVSLYQQENAPQQQQQADFGQPGAGPRGVDAASGDGDFGRDGSGDFGKGDDPNASTNVDFGKDGAGDFGKGASAPAADAATGDVPADDVTQGDRQGELDFGKAMPTVYTLED